MLDIPSLKDENPTDYQLLGIDDFEGDPDKIAAAHQKRKERIGELRSLVSEMAEKIDAARDRVSDSQLKEEYDYDLRRKGLAGASPVGKLGFLAIFFSFTFSIFLVTITTFYIYPMVVAVPVENFGDSVTTLPDYNASETKKEISALKVHQEDVTTMDVNFNMPIDVDEDTAVDFVDIPVSDVPQNDPSVDDLPVPDDSSTTDELPSVDLPTPEQPAAPSEELPTPEQPASEPEVPAIPEEAPDADELAPVPELPADPEQPAAPETPAVPEDAPALPEEAPVTEESVIEEPAAEQDEQTLVKPTEESPEVIVEPLAPETPSPEAPSPQSPAPEASSPETPSPEAPAVPVGKSDPDTPTVPRVYGLESSGIPELPPLEELSGAEPPIAPLPPAIPTLSDSEPQLSLPGANAPRLAESSVIVETPSPIPPTTNVVLEDVNSLEHFVQMSQKARTDADFAQLLFSASQTEEELMKKKQFQEALQIADVVYASCSRSSDKAYRAEAYRHKDLVSKRAQRWSAVQSAQTKMKTNGTISPADANIIAQWSIEIENDWEQGLNYLSLSENEQVRSAAKNELSVNQNSVRSILIVANGWWNLSQEPVPLQRHFRAHAGSWYAKALPMIADKQIRTLVEKRIELAEQGGQKALTTSGKW